MASIPLSATDAGRSDRTRFTLCVFAGSFLLFLVQPMIARMALPRLGGAPAVWNSAMLVYQALLLGGYAYAHLLGRLAPRRQAVIHLTLFGLAALTLPLSLIDATPPSDGNIFIWVPWLLIVSIGPLFLIISAQAPLMQRWYTLIGAANPYPLYAASNFGSFLGLLAYPLIVEPLLPVRVQSEIWSFGYAILALLMAVCALRLPPRGPQEVRHTAAKLGFEQIGRWVLLAAVPSGLMLSTTLHLTTDIVAMPLLWVMPLGLYLLSFSIAFAARRSAAEFFTRLAPYALLVTACTISADVLPAPMMVMTAVLISLFAIAVAVHAKLFDFRPAPAHLTVFYLWTSLGGMLGGLFCALLAPLTFDWTYEHPILVLAAACLVAVRNPFERLAAVWETSPRAALIARWLAIAALFLSLVDFPVFGVFANPLSGFVGMLGIIALGIVGIGNRILFVSSIAALMLAGGGWEKLALSFDGRMTRSFFGIYAVRELDGNARMLVHGTTIHGIENVNSPSRERMTTSYYAPRSGVGLVMQALPAMVPGARVGVVGLGIGTLACTSKPDQDWRFYEIDPKVVAIARDSERFRFLSDCLPQAPTIVGDARIMIEQAPAGSNDVLVIDAFSSDSVPMHLLTLEAFALYRRKITDRGLLMVHVSNRFLDLQPVVSAAAAAQGWTARVRSYAPTEAEKASHHASGSVWIMLSPAVSTVATIERSSGPGSWGRLPAPISAPWTDDQASILPIIKW